jgi:hypothetical protein
MKHLKLFEDFVTPSYFSDKKPFSSVYQKSEYETIAKNIMVILDRTGDEFRNLSWKEYKKERLKDGNFSDAEKMYFDVVIEYCTTPEKAKTFSKNWDYELHAKKDATKYNL